MQIVLNLTDALIVLAGIGAIQFLLGVWIKSRLESSIKSEYDKVLEDYRFDLKTREQAAKTAEYISLARDLKATSSEADYRRANQLAWELALWLPDGLYRKLGSALTAQSPDNNILSVLIEIRGFLLRNPGTLNDSEVIHHAPNVGSLRNLGN